MPNSDIDNDKEWKDLQDDSEESLEIISSF